MRALMILVLGCCIAAPAAAQRPTVPPVDSAAVVSLRLTDGSELVGRVVAADDSSLTIVTLAAARVHLPRTSIVSWRPVAGQTTARGFQPADPNTTRLFFGPTGRTLEQGSGYFADYYLFFPVVGYGVHDRVTLSAGMSIIPGLSSQLLYVTAKVGVVRSDNAAVALGGFYATVPDEADAALGTAYGVATFGSTDHAITFMGGYPFTTQEVAQEPLFMMGGETRIGRRTKVLGELWKFPETSEVPVVFGLRLFGDRLAVDFGFVYALGSSTEGWPLVPWVDFAVNW
jgi:hypothetical protein